MIDAGAAGVHFEDQLASAKKCGHLGGKVLVPIQEFINKLVSARLAADLGNGITQQTPSYRFPVPWPGMWPFDPGSPVRKGKTLCCPAGCIL